MGRREKQITTSENTLSFGIQDSLKISESKRDHIINYIKMASKGPEDICNILKEIPLNFKENDKYFAVYIVSLFVIHHSDKIKKEDKRDAFLDDMWSIAAKCFDLDLDNLLAILSELLKKKNTLIEVINGPFKENEKIVLLFLHYLAMLGTIRRDDY
jgi:hypothetical protein